MIVGIGCDLCKIKRVNSKIAQKILTENEMSEYLSYSSQRQQEWLAGRFAMKEAIMKATGILSMSDIEIVTTTDGSPQCILDGRENDKLFLSISHDGEYAMAMAVVEHD